MIFLAEYHVAEKTELEVSGEKIFELYERLFQQKKDDFIAVKTQLKRLQGIMSQFIFSLMTHSRSMERLDIGAHGEERMGMYYLSYWKEDNVYDYKFGLIETGEPAIIL
jgi:CRISPR-associated endonuclease/helicase Cas3